MKFKIGDKIKMNERGRDACAYLLDKTAIFTVSGPENPYFDEDDFNNGNKVYYKRDNGTYNGWLKKYFELANPKVLVTETDYLDAFQQNFREP